MSKCKEKDGKWSFRVAAPTRNGTKYNKLPYLWDSEEDAMNDISLYIWYMKDSRLREPNEPKLESISSKKWFTETKPDEEWILVREYLKSLSNEVIITKETEIKRKYSKTGTKDYGYEMRKRKRNELRVLCEDQEVPLNRVNDIVLSCKI